MAAIELEDETLIAHAPVFLLEARDRCYRCKSWVTVIALAGLAIEEYGAPINVIGDKDLVILAYIELMPPDIEEFLTRKYPRFKKIYSHTAERFYFANTCACGSFVGDHYLTRVDGPFFPTDKGSAAKISMSPLPFAESSEFQATWSSGSAGTLIYNHAKSEKSLSRC